MGVSGFGDRLLHARDRGLGLESALSHGRGFAALNRAVLAGLPFGSRGMGLTLTTDNGTQFTSARYVETLNQLASRTGAPLITIPRATVTSNAFIAA